MQCCIVEKMLCDMHELSYFGDKNKYIHDNNYESQVNDKIWFYKNVVVRYPLLQQVS